MKEMKQTLLLSAPEAAAYVGIGVKRMRSELKNPLCKYSVWIGERCYAVKSLLEEFYIIEASK